MFKLAIAGLGWWGKVIINRLSTSKNIKIVFLIDPKPDSDAVRLAANKKIPIADTVLRLDVTDGWKEILLLMLGGFVGSFAKVIDFWFNNQENDNKLLEHADD